jgi:hypothetical protein
MNINNFQDKRRVVCMDGHVIWTLKCTKYLCEIDEPRPTILLIPLYSGFILITFKYIQRMEMDNLITIVRCYEH